MPNDVLDNFDPENQDLDQNEQEENAENEQEEEEGGEDGEDVDYKALYEEEKTKREKFEGRYKSAKKKQSKKSNSDDNNDDVEERIFNRVSFYNKNPDAQELQEEIEDYVQKGLSRDDAYALILAKQSPEKLVDPAYNNKTKAGKMTIQGTKSSRTALTENNIMNAKSVEELDNMLG